MTGQRSAVPARKVPLNVTADGELELGGRFTEPPKPLVWTGSGRKCTICGEPTMWRRPTSVRGAPVHPECETGFFDEMTGDALADIEFSLVEQLGAHTRIAGWHQPPAAPPESKRLGRADAGCELCRRPLRGLLDRRRSLAMC